MGQVQKPCLSALLLLDLTHPPHERSDPDRRNEEGSNGEIILDFTDLEAFDGVHKKIAEQRRAKNRENYG